MSRRISRSPAEPPFQDRLRAIARAGVAKFGGAALAFLGGWLAVAFATYSVSDNSFNTATFRETSNWMGPAGAFISDLFLQNFGGAALLFCPPLMIWGVIAFLNGEAGEADRSPREFWLRIACFVIAFLAASAALATFPVPSSWPFTVGIGGATGDALAGAVTSLLVSVGLVDALVVFLMATIFTAVAISGFCISCGLTRERLEEAYYEAEYICAVIYNYIAEQISGWRLTEGTADIGDLEKTELDYTQEDDAEEFEEDETEDDGDVAPAKKRNIIRKQGKRKASKREVREMQPEFPVFSPGNYELPALGLLGKPPSNRPTIISDEALEQNARMLESVLADFGVRGEIINVRPGPVVTLYELEPAAGIKSSRVIGLADDIARSMSAVAARVAVVPGRNAIGIELPNQNRETVFIRELLSAPDYEKTRGDLTLALGKGIGGEPSFADLARMPHLLIAGTTGSGKSVGINTMILSLLYRLSPENCKMIMIDPKMLELSVYEGIPHLLAPVVTDPRKAVVALKWTVREMEERYRRMSKVGVRNIEGFNQRVREADENNEVLTRTVHTGYDGESGEPIYETEELDYEAMAFIVVIIDEVADLMMVAGKDIEGMVQRLAQMARAAGIHLIMATQRPSVDVITGTIKANFPTRISFQVTSKIDSRTILGEQGAEQLLGMGDMLFMAGGGRIKRVHGAFVSDDEVEKVVKFLKKQGKPEYIQEVTEIRDEEDGAVAGLDVGGNTSSGDALYDKAVAIVLRDRKASTSYVQRRLQIGYNRAATLIERMEDEGVISSANHAGKREILVGEDAA